MPDQDAYSSACPRCCCHLSFVSYPPYPPGCICSADCAERQRCTPATWGSAGSELMDVTLTSCELELIHDGCKLVPVCLGHCRSNATALACEAFSRGRDIHIEDLLHEYRLATLPTLEWLYYDVWHRNVSDLWLCNKVLACCPTIAHCHERPDLPLFLYFSGQRLSSRVLCHPPGRHWTSMSAAVTKCAP